MITKQIQINIEEGEDVVTVIEEVLRLVKEGFTSGVYPDWDIVEIK